MRMAGFIISVALPGIYISLLDFSRSLLPSEMASMLIAAESMVPIPLTIEVIIVDLLVLLIFEVGISLPTVLGGTIGVFGSSADLPAQRFKHAGLSVYLFYSKTG